MEVKKRIQTTNSKASYFIEIDGHYNYIITNDQSIDSFKLKFYDNDKNLYK